MKKSFSRSIDSLAAIFAMVETFAQNHKLDSEDQYMLGLAIEEIFTNMVKYSPESSRDICVELNLSGDSLTATVTDFDVDAFDVTAHTGADMDRAAEQGAPGGRGLYLVNEVMDNIDYQYNDRISQITMTKRIKGQRAGN